MKETSKDLIFGDEARARLRAGVNKLSNAVRETMGPRGRNVVFEREYGSPYVTKDGVSVAKEVSLRDPFENMGAQVIKEVAANTADQAGDGPQPLWSLIQTPTGPITMGQAKVGLEILGTNGTTQTIEGVYPKGEKEICKVLFLGGEAVECSPDHLFTVHIPVVLATEPNAGPADDTVNDVESSDDTVNAPVNDVESSDDTVNEPANDADSSDGTVNEPANDAGSADDTVNEPANDVESSDDTVNDAEHLEAYCSQTMTVASLKAMVEEGNQVFVYKEVPGVDPVLIEVFGVYPTGVMTDMQCIKVSNEDHLYLTDGYITTHNTTTATVLAQSIINEGEKMIAAGCSPVELKRGLDKMCGYLTHELRELARPVADLNDIANVASISANNEPALGELIAQAIDSVGKDGVVSVQEGRSSDHQLVMEDGYVVDSPVIARHFIPSDQTSVTYENCFIVTVDQDIQSVQEILPLMQLIHKAGKPLLMVCNSMVGPALHTMITNFTAGQVKVAVVQSPSFGEHREQLLEDIAIVTGAKAVFGQKAQCKPLQEATLADLGIAARVNISKTSTTIIDGTSDTSLIHNRLAALAELRECTGSEFEKEKLQKRMAALSGGVAVIYVGGNSEVEVKEAKDRVEDALHATRAAIKGGIVPGGGTALVWAARACIKLATEKGVPHDQVMGRKLLLKVVESPLRQIVMNAGASPDVVLDRVSKGKKGYNARTDKYEDLVASGVIDPVNVTISALTNAVSVAGTLLTTSCAIAMERNSDALSIFNSAPSLN